VHDVLQADWQEVWHSPHPPFAKVFLRFLPDKVFMYFKYNPPFLHVQSHAQ